MIELFGITNKNYLHNAEFNINQRGLTVYDSQALGTSTFSNFYTLDRWRWSASSTAGTGATARVQITREVFAADQAEVEGSPRYFLRVTNLTTSAIASDRQHSLKQNIESVNCVANKNITISFWARSSIAGKQIGVSLNPIQSTNGSRPGNSFTAPTQGFSLTSTWQKFSVTMRPALLSGFVVGTSGNDNMEFSIFLDYLPPSGGTAFVGAWEGTGTTDFACIQIENGVEATNFETRQFAIDLLICQRYYWKSQGQLFAIGYNDGFFPRQIFIFSTPVPMRAMPTVTSTSMSIYDSGNVVTRAVKTITVSAGNQLILIDYIASSTSTFPVLLFNNGTTEFITASAEY